MYVKKSTGDMYGTMPDGSEVLVAKGVEFPSQDPSVSIIKDANGSTVALNTRTGNIQNLGQFDWATINPERVFQQSAQAQAQTTASGLRGQDINAGVTQRGQDVNAGLTARGQDIQSAQYGTDLGLKESEIIRQILSNPADYVSRAWLSAGKAAPGGTITQADLMNALQGVVGQYKQPAPYVAPPQYQAPGIGSYAGQVASAYPISQATPLATTKPTPTPTPTTTSTTAATPAPAAPAANYGGFTLAQLQAMQKANVPAYAFTPEQQKALGITYTPTAAPAEPMKAIDVAPQTSSAPAYNPALYSVSDTMGGTGYEAPAPKASRAAIESIADLATSERPYVWGDASGLGYAAGGMTHEPAFIVGDARDGHKTGYEEMIVNPTGAPIKVVPNSRLPRFADGTPDYLKEPYSWYTPFTKPMLQFPKTDNALVDTALGLVSDATSPLSIALMAIPGGPAAKIGKYVLGASRLGKLAGMIAPEAATAAEAVAPEVVPAAQQAQRIASTFLKKDALSPQEQAQRIAGTFFNKPLTTLERAAVPEQVPLDKAVFNEWMKENVASQWPSASNISLGSRLGPLSNIPSEVAGGRAASDAASVFAELSKFANKPSTATELPQAVLQYIRDTGAGLTRPIDRTEVEAIFSNGGAKLTNAGFTKIQNLVNEARINLVPSVLGNSREYLPLPSSATDISALNALGLTPETLPSNFAQRLGAYAPPFGTRPAPRGAQARSLFGYAEGTGNLPRYAAGSEDIVGAAGSGATGVTPADVSMGYLSGPAYDWYDAETGGYGYGAFNPGSPEPNTQYPAPQAAPSTTIPQVAGAPAGSLKPITQQDIVSLARQWSPPSVSAVLGEGSAVPRQLPVRSASMRQTSNLTPEDVQALGSRLAAEGTSLTDYNALQQGLFGAKRGTRRGRLVI